MTRQLTILGIIIATVGIVVSITLAIVGRFTLSLFDSRTKAARDNASKEIGDDFDARIKSETEGLREQNTQSLKLLETNLSTTIQQKVADVEALANYVHAQVLAFSCWSSGNLSGAVSGFRNAVTFYARNKGSIGKGLGIRAIVDLFTCLKSAAKEDFPTQGQTELQKPIYKLLTEELLEAARLSAELRDVLSAPPAAP